MSDLDNGWTVAREDEVVPSSGAVTALAGLGIPHDRDSVVGRSTTQSLDFTDQYGNPDQVSGWVYLSLHGCLDRRSVLQ